MKKKPKAFKVSTFREQAAGIDGIDDKLKFIEHGERSNEKERSNLLWDWRRKLGTIHEVYSGDLVNAMQLIGREYYAARQATQEARDGFFKGKEWLDQYDEPQISLTRETLFQRLALMDSDFFRSLADHIDEARAAAQFDDVPGQGDWGEGVCGFHDWQDPQAGIIAMAYWECSRGNGVPTFVDVLASAREWDRSGVLPENDESCRNIARSIGLQFSDGRKA